MTSLGHRLLRVAAALAFVLAVLDNPLLSLAFVGVVAILLKLEEKK